MGIFDTGHSESIDGFSSVIKFVQLSWHCCQLILNFFLFNCCLLRWIWFSCFGMKNRITNLNVFNHWKKLKFQNRLKFQSLIYILAFPLQTKGPKIYFTLLKIVIAPPYLSAFTGIEFLSVRIPSSTRLAPKVSQLQTESEFKASTQVPSIKHWQPVSEGSLVPLQYVFTIPLRFIQEEYFVSGFTVHVCLIDWLQLVEISAKAWI